MAYKMFSTGLVFALVGMCMCQAASNTPSQYQSLQAVSQSSFQSAPAVAPQTRLEDIERDALKSPQASTKATGPSPAVSLLQAQQQPAAGQVLAYPQQQYFVQPYQGQQQQYLAQQYPATFDYSGVQYMFINPAAYNQVYQPYYMQPAQPSAVPQYVTKSQNSSPASASSPSASAASPTSNQGPVEFKQQFASAPNAAAAPSLAAYKQAQYVEAAPAPAFQYVPQPAVNPADFAYVTRHPSTAQFKTSAPTAGVQPQFQYATIPQQFQQPQFYFNVPAVQQQQTFNSVPQQQTFNAVPQQQTFNAVPQQQTFNASPVEQTRIQQSFKSQFSSGIKSTTAAPTKGSDFAYKFESSPPQSQSPNSGAYSTLRF